MTHQSSLYQIRGSERIDYKRCQLKWFWHWRLGLVPKAKIFGALDLGTWVHAVLALWYTSKKRRPGDLADYMRYITHDAIQAAVADNAPEHVIESAEELAALAIAIMQHYGEHYGRDESLTVIGVEVPLEFSFDVEILNAQGEYESVTVVHKLKPDAVVRERGRIVLLETKTASTIRIDHIPIDDQARPYLSMAEKALRDIGMLSRRERLRGILYNHLRKAPAPSKPLNAEGKVLNKDGSVSARQPSPFFRRTFFPMSDRAKAQVLLRLYAEVEEISRATKLLRTDPGLWVMLGKTPHYSCPRFCEYFTMCSLHDEGADITAMRKSLYVQRDPYLYDEEHPTTDERASFELG